MEVNDKSKPKLKSTFYTAITVISEKKYEIEFTMCFTNISTSPIEHWSMGADVPSIFLQDPEAKWSILDKRKWQNIPSDSKIEKKEVNIGSGLNTGIVIKSTSNVMLEENGERHIYFGIRSNMSESLIEVKLPIKEKIFYKINNIRWKTPPHSTRDESGYRILKWEKPTILQTGARVNEIEIFYRYRIPFREYTTTVLIQIIFMIASFFIGLLLGVLIFD